MQVGVRGRVGHSGDGGCSSATGVLVLVVFDS